MPAGGFLQLYHAVDSDLISQAESVIQANSYQIFCSALLGYVTPVVTICQTNTATNIVSVSVIITIDVTYQRTSTQINTVTLTVSTQTNILHRKWEHEKHQHHAKRITSNTTPTSLTGFPASIITAACQAEASSITVTSLDTIAAYATVDATSVLRNAVTITAATLLNVASIVVTTTTVPVINCPAATVTPPNYSSYSMVFHGTGVRENANNPGNFFAPPQTTQLPVNSDTSCSAVNDTVSQCAAYAEAMFYALGNDYDSFDVHFLIAQSAWECVVYYDYQTSTAYFNVPDSNIDIVYGYSV